MAALVTSFRVVFLVSNGGCLIFARLIRFSYCSSEAVKALPGVAGLISFAVSQACLKICFDQLSFGIPIFSLLGREVCSFEALLASLGPPLGV